MNDTDALPSHPAPVRRPTARFMLAHPAHVIALGFGSGLSPVAPGTAGTLWAWLCFLALQQWLSSTQLGLLIAASFLLGWWACTVTAQHMQIADSGHIVWDEIAAFWLVLWLLMPAGWLMQLQPLRCFVCLTPSSPSPWPGRTGTSRVSVRAAALASCWTTCWPPFARCWCWPSGKPGGERILFF